MKEGFIVLPYYWVKRSIDITVFNNQKAIYEFKVLMKQRRTK